jgi:organic hydroperoxide reductase OsmC/OhrA
MSKLHHYQTNIIWTGNTKAGTTGYADYERSHVISIMGKPKILGSSDAPFRGDVSKHNPEDMLLASLSSCHMLWYLHLCADAGIVVVAYEDNATGTLSQNANGSGKFTEVILHPVVTVAKAAMVEQSIALHDKANEYCFMANSVNFTVQHVATSQSVD